MEVDVVYTWVNHKDAGWQAMYKNATSNRGDIQNEHESVNDPARFTSRNELFYSIRSVLKYAPWVRKIYVVSNCRLPDWHEAIDSLVYVPHEEIFPDSRVLPTFNSHAIESNFHRISGISENILYFNDDVFLCQHVRPEDFFWGDGKVYFFPSKHAIPYEKPSYSLRPMESGAINAAMLLNRDFNFKPLKKLHHTAHPLSKSLLEEIEERYSVEIEATRSHQFRHIDDLPMATTFHAYYAKCAGRGRVKKIASRYVDIGDPLFVLLVHPWSPLMRGKYTTLCLNEVASPRCFHGIRDRIVNWVMKRLFL